MVLYNTKDMIKIIRNSHPLYKNFYKIKKAEGIFCDGKPGDYATIWDYFVLKEVSLTSEDKKKIFDIAEDLIVNGDEDVGTFICTFFLEGVVNIIGHNPDKYNYKDYIPLIEGKEARKYLKACDEFWGAKTPYLWD